MKKLFPVLTLIITSAFLLLILKPWTKLEGDRLTIATPSPSPSPSPAQPIVLSAWLPWCDDQRVVASLEKSKQALTQILPLWYSLNQNGVISELKVGNKDQVLAQAKGSNLPVIASIGNDFDGKRVHILLADPKLQRQQIDFLIKNATTSGFFGYDLDWEEIKPADKNDFSKFVQELADTFHSKGLTLSITVHAQTGSKSDWVGTKGQDIATIAKSVDSVRIMAYDFHNEKSPPGPITPLDILTAVLEYNQSIIPKEKLVLGLPNYGYDWSDKGASPITYTDAVKLLEQHQIVQARDPNSLEPYFKYQVGEVSHTVWYQDRGSIVKKIALARSFGIYRFCFWRLGGEDASFWELDQNAI